MEEGEVLEVGRGDSQDEVKELFTTNPNFPLDMQRFKLVEKKKSKYF